VRYLTKILSSVEDDDPIAKDMVYGSSADVYAELTEEGIFHGL
jgi:hypothetical protein